MRFERHLIEDELIEEYLSEAPIATAGWTQKSITKFGKTLGKGPKEKGFFDACVARMEGKEGFDKEKAAGFCSSIKDSAWGSGHWRGSKKSKEQVKKDTKKHKFKKQLPEK